MVIQILISLFILFVLSRIVLRWRDGSISFGESIFWLLLWIAVGLLVLLPQTSAVLAKVLGVGRGADAVVYISIIILFYAMFRVVVKLEFIEHEITQIVRNLTIQNAEREQRDQRMHADPPNS